MTQLQQKTLPVNWAEVEERLVGGTTQRRGEAVFHTRRRLLVVGYRRASAIWIWPRRKGWRCWATAIQSLSEALAKQAHTLIACPNFLYNDTRARFAAKLEEVLPAHLNHIFLANSGAEAIDGGLKFATLGDGTHRHHCHHAQLSWAHRWRGLDDLGTQISQAL